MAIIKWFRCRDDAEQEMGHHESDQGFDPTRATELRIQVIPMVRVSDLWLFGFSLCRVSSVPESFQTRV